MLTLKVRDELELCREECNVLKERLSSCEEEVKWEKKCSMEKSLEIDQLKNDLKLADIESKQSQEANLEILSSELHQANEKVDSLQKELICLNKEREHLLAKIKQFDRPSALLEDFQNVQNQLLAITKEKDLLITQIEEQHRLLAEAEFSREHSNIALSKAKVQVEELTQSIANMEVKIHNDEVKKKIESAKLKMRLRGTQARMDAFHLRYNQAIDESDTMNTKFKEASQHLKELLASKGIEVLNLKKQLAAAKGQ